MSQYKENYINNLTLVIWRCVRCVSYDRIVYLVEKGVFKGCKQGMVY